VLFLVLILKAVPQWGFQNFFYKEAFAKIDWQTSKVLEQLQALYSAQNLAIWRL
jgi:hypothetical protein